MVRTAYEGDYCSRCCLAIGDAVRRVLALMSAVSILSVAMALTPSPPFAPASAAQIGAVWPSTAITAAGAGDAAFTPRVERLLDTRSTAKVKPAETVDVPVVGASAAPVDASAVVLNVTITDTTGPGFVSVYPKPSARELSAATTPARTTSSMNADEVGQTRANHVTVAIGDEGKVQVYTEGGTHVIVDLVGYYRPVATATVKAGRFHVATQSRLVDTRRSGGSVAAGSERTIDIVGRGGVPTGALAVVLNVTAVEMSEPGYVTVYTGGAARPATSNVNVDADGGTAANLVTVPLSTTGAVTFYANQSTSLIVDLVGWYTGGDAELSSNGLFRAADRRLLDTRSGTKPTADSSRAISLPDAAPGEAILLNVVMTGATRAGFATVFPTDEGRRTTSTVNTDIDQTIANAAVVASVGGVSLYADPSSHVIVDQQGSFIVGDATTDVNLRLLSLNDYHGYLQPPAGGDANLGPFDAAATPVGGGEYLATTLAGLRTGSDHTLTVAAGDLVGGTPFLSGLFHDEPSVESLESMALDVSSVGNHEFDEGLTELLRMQNGGCHPADGCYFPTDPYDGANFPWLAANVVHSSTGSTVLPPTWVKDVSGIKVGFIGMTLEGTPELVAQVGIQGLEFRDEIVSANAAAASLKARGVKAIVVLLHEGGVQTGTFNGCTGISGPIVAIAQGLDAEIDMVVSGHTHQPYVCSINDPNGQPRMVTSASSFGRVVTDTTLKLSRTTGDVDRASVASVNRLVVRTVAKDAQQSKIIAKWNDKSAPLANRVVGSLADDLVRAPNRDAESSLSNAIADAQLDATKGNGAQIALMNPGGVRADLKKADIGGGEKVGEVTFGESFTVQPFGNLLVTVDMTGAQLEQVLEQQAVASRSRPVLILGVSKGLEFSYSAGAAFGDRINPASIKLNGVVVSPTTTYKVTVNNFLADGGDGFTVFAAGLNRVGGGDDLAAFNAYLAANSPLASPGTGRIIELP
jgi:2',3'-cyclic-nucleotide 2'-phosphodiesterase (5'-nucleotidase family)